MAVNVNGLRSRLVKVRKMYDRFDGNYYNERSDEEYKADYQIMDREAKSLEADIGRAWDQLVAEINRTAAGVAQAAKDTTGRQWKSIRSKLEKLMDQKKVVEFYEEELINIDHEYMAPNGRRFR